MMPARRNRPRGPIDWATVRQRLDTMRLALAAEPGPEQMKAILDERARALARPIASPAASDLLEVMTFAVGKEEYAIETRYLFQVFALKTLAQVPGAKPPVAGLTSWRGDLLTVLDLRSIIGLATSGPSDLGRVLVVGDRHPAFGILADAVHELITVSTEELATTPGDEVVRRTAVRGMTAGAVLVLDGKSLVRIGA